MAIVFSVLLSFIAICGFRYEVTDDYLKHTNTYSPFWLLLFCFCLAGYRKRLRQAAGVIPACFYWLFFLLAPGSNFRYICPLMTAYPLLLCHAGLPARGERLSTPGGKQNYKS